MPRYDYVCDHCESKYEIMHPIDMPTLATALPTEVAITKSKLCCAKAGCKQKPLTKLISAPGIKTVVRGNRDFAQRERERLTKRSNDQWEAKGYKEAVDRVVAKGLPPSAVPKQNPRG